MNRLFHLLNTTIGRKLILGFSGLFLLLFIIGHVAGNLTLYMGPSALNSYAHWLQESSMLWFVRLGMLFIVGVHILLAIRVSLDSINARSMDYQSHTGPLTRLYQKRMMLSGLLLLLFVIGHIAHLTLGYGTGETFNWLDERGFKDVYARVVIEFHNPYVAWSYIVAMLLLAVHLQHSVRALFQTMGFFHDNYFVFYETVSWAITLFVLIGLGSIPLGVQLGWIDVPTSEASACVLQLLAGSAA